MIQFYLKKTRQAGTISVFRADIFPWYEYLFVRVVWKWYVLLGGTDNSMRTARVSFSVFRLSIGLRETAGEKGEDTLFIQTTTYIINFH